MVAGEKKLRWLCECGHRFNTIPEAAGTYKRCVKCRMEDFLPEVQTVMHYVCPMCNYDFESKEEAVKCCSGEEE